VTARQRKRLEVLLAGNRAGILEQDGQGRLILEYDEEWRRSPVAFPLSLSMPLAARTHQDSVVRAFLWGLLPDNEGVLERWARTYHVSARNPFALLTHVGEDCAGAVQLVSPERVDALAAGVGGVEWIDDDEVGRRLRVLGRDPAAWHLARAGQFSLAGAQAKTAMHFDPGSGRWGDAWGAVPSTHILKPAVSGFDDHDLNEHLCLEAARLCGLSGARSRVVSFGAERAIAVERYDRIRAPTGAAPDATVRVHQEDACQALGVAPTAKYQNEGGPGPEAIVDLLRREIHLPDNARDVERFVDALAFNWLIAGTDAHAKNYSVLLAPAQVRLAPLYDVASALPYDDLYLPRLVMAMRIGGEYRIEAVAGRHWRRFAAANAMEPDRVVERVAQLAGRLPDAFAAAAAAGPVETLESDLPPRLVDRVTARARRCAAALA
jgi:serine/threonine-protein kinase HipA